MPSPENQESLQTTFLDGEVADPGLAAIQILTHQQEVAIAERHAEYQQFITIATSRTIIKPALKKRRNIFICDLRSPQETLTFAAWNSTRYHLTDIDPTATNQEFATNLQPHQTRSGDLKKCAAVIILINHDNLIAAQKAIRQHHQHLGSSSCVFLFEEKPLSSSPLTPADKQALAQCFDHQPVEFTRVKVLSRLPEIPHILTEAKRRRKYIDLTKPHHDRQTINVREKDGTFSQVPFSVSQELDRMRRRLTDRGWAIIDESDLQEFLSRCPSPTTAYQFLQADFPPGVTAKRVGCGCTYHQPIDPKSEPKSHPCDKHQHIDLTTGEIRPGPNGRRAIPPREKPPRHNGRHQDQSTNQPPTPPPAPPDKIDLPWGTPPPITIIHVSPQDCVPDPTGRLTPTFTDKQMAVLQSDDSNVRVVISETPPINTTPFAPRREESSERNGKHVWFWKKCPKDHLTPPRHTTYEVTKPGSSSSSPFRIDLPKGAPPPPNMTSSEHPWEYKTQVLGLPQDEILFQDSRISPAIESAAIDYFGYDQDRTITFSARLTRQIEMAADKQGRIVPCVVMLISNDMGMSPNERYLPTSIVNRVIRRIGQIPDNEEAIF